MAIYQRAGDGASPSSALRSLPVKPIPMRTAKAALVKEHYLHSLSGGAMLAFGVFLADSLLSAITLGAGPANFHRLVDGAAPEDCCGFQTNCPRIANPECWEW